MIKEFDYQFWLRKTKEIADDIDKSIRESNSEGRQSASKKVIEVLRHFVNAICCCLKEKYQPTSPTPNQYSYIEDGIAFVSSNSKFNFLSEFYKNLDTSISHYFQQEQYAERLVLKYLSNLLDIKLLLKRELSIDLLLEIDRFPLDMDDTFEKYYKIIIKSLSNFSEKQSLLKGAYCYYVNKKKKIYCDNTVIYEYVLASADDHNSKLDNFIVFSKIDIFDNYCIKAAFEYNKIKVFEESFEIVVLVAYEVSIRPCEFEKMLYICNIPIQKFERTSEYLKLMSYIQEKRLSIDKIVLFPKQSFNFFFNQVFQKSKISTLAKFIISCNKMLTDNLAGKNVLIYLLHTMRNDVLDEQKSLLKNELVSNLRLDNKVLPFETAPFAFSLKKHNPKINTLLECFDVAKFYSQLIKRELDNLSIEQALLYIELPNQNIPIIDEQIKLFNDSIPSRYNSSKIRRFGKYAYIEGYEKNTHDLLCFLINYSKRKSFPGYGNYAASRLLDPSIAPLDDEGKKTALKNMYSEGDVFGVYGSAGTGKTTFANLALSLLGTDQKVICLANTNAAVNNLKSRIKQKVKAYTIDRFIKSSRIEKECDILVIDECSNISTDDMLKVIRAATFKLLLLLGDTYQIEPIRFGNWFSLLRYFISQKSFIDLDTEYRSQHNKNLPKLWEKVRNVEDNIQELIEKYEISKQFGPDVFEKKKDDEVILCLNYDGLYGINSINKYLQVSNKNKGIRWKQYDFRVGDPIVFVDNMFSETLYNNLKGVIIDVDQSDEQLKFVIKVYRAINPLNDVCGNFELIDNCGDGTSIISLIVNKFKPEDYDYDTAKPNYRIPFQIAYAISIHKSQGLEYNSVKIIITNEVEEMISHNIFYTAITRAREELTIYWTPETETKIISSLKVKNCKRDAQILLSKYPDLLRNK